MKRNLLIAALIIPAIIYFSFAFVAIVLQALLIVVVHIMDTINNKIEKYIK
jgi:diacylglycerol kinase